MGIFDGLLSAGAAFLTDGASLAVDVPAEAAALGIGDAALSGGVDVAAEAAGLGGGVDASGNAIASPSVDSPGFTNGVSDAMPSSVPLPNTPNVPTSGSSWSDFLKAAAPFTPLATGALGFAGQQDTNQLQRDLASQAQAFSAQQAQAAFDRSSSFDAAQAEIARQFNASQAGIGRDFASSQSQKAMDFSERMSDTQWQRTVADMSAAGLNPMLAYMRGANSSPGGTATSSGIASGPAASASSGVGSAFVPQIGNKLAAGINSAQSGAMTQATVNELSSRAAQQDALVKVAANTADNLVADTHLKSGQEARVKFEIGALVAKIGLDNEHARRVMYEIDNILSDSSLKGEQERLAIQEVILKNYESMHSALDIPRAQAESGKYSTWMGSNVVPWLKDANSAAELFRQLSPRSNLTITNIGGRK